MPNQERLVFIFLEGLKNKNLHATLYMKHHKNLNQCINDAIDYDDNCGDDEKKDNKGSRASSSTSSIASQVEEITRGVIKKMQQLYGPPRAMEPRRSYVCGHCGQNHPTSQCLLRNPMANRQEGHPALWCDFDKKWGNYTTEEFYNHIKFMRGLAMMGGMPNVGQEGERPISVLDRQPPLPKATPMRIIGQEEDLN